MLVEKNKKAAISTNNVNDLDEAAIKKSLEEVTKKKRLILLLDVIGGIIITTMFIVFDIIPEPFNWIVSPIVIVPIGILISLSSVRVKTLKAKIKTYEESLKLIEAKKGNNE